MLNQTAGPRLDCSPHPASGQHVPAGLCRGMGSAAHPVRASSHRAADNPLRAHGRLGAACGIEYAAQAMAVHGALLAPPDSAAAGRLSGQRARRHSCMCHGWTTSPPICWRKPPASRAAKTIFFISSASAQRVACCWTGAPRSCSMRRTHTALGEAAMKNALVTGGSGGIGAAICRRLAADGCHVYIHANRNLAKAAGRWPTPFAEPAARAGAGIRCDRRARPAACAGPPRRGQRRSRSWSTMPASMTTPCSPACAPSSGTG